MSVYTTVTLNEVQHLAQSYLLQATQLTPIQAGIENTNYFVHTAHDTQLVLTIFEEMNLIAIQELIPLLTFLKQQGLSVAAPLTDQNGQVIHFIQNKPAQLAPRLIGQPPMHASLGQVTAMGKALAQLHVTLRTYPLHRDNNHGQVWWQQTRDQLMPRLTPVEQALINRVFAQFEQARQHYPDRPCGLIHGDLFRDNTLFDGEQLSGLLDFSELAYDELLLDIAICLNDFCSQWPNVALDQPKAQAFIAAYHQVRALTSDEQQAMPVYLAMVACRFWLSRLQIQWRNQQEARSGQHILQKDPAEMRAMLKDRLQSPFFIQSI